MKQDIIDMLIGISIGIVLAIGGLMIALIIK